MISKVNAIRRSSLRIFAHTRSIGSVTFAKLLNELKREDSLGLAPGVMPQPAAKTLSPQSTNSCACRRCKHFRIETLGENQEDRQIHRSDDNRSLVNPVVLG